MFEATLFIITKNWKQPRHPLAGKQINKLWYVHTIKYCSEKKKKEYASDACNNTNDS